MEKAENRPPSSEVNPKIKLSEIVSKDHLEMISGASGFSFAEDNNSEHLGYTNSKTKTIYINTRMAQGLGLSKRGLEGFLDHEVGHHTKEAVQFQNFMLDNIEKMEIPDAYKGSPTSRENFKSALWKNLGNGLADIFLETYMGRYPYGAIADNYKILSKEMGRRETLKGLLKPDQFIQYMLVEARYDPSRAEELIDEDVLNAFRRLEKSGAIKALMNVRPYTNVFSTPADKERGMKKRFEAYEKAFLPEYLALMKNEVEERKQEREQQKGQGGQQGEGQAQGEAQQGEGQRGGSSVPLTAEEEQELKEQMLKELAGQNECGKSISSPEQQKRMKDFEDKVKEQAQKDTENRDNETKNGEEEKDERSAADKIRDEQDRLRKEDQESKERGLAASTQVKQESVKQWSRIKTERRIEIESLASGLAEVFIDDRRKRIEFLKREGDLVPGLEYETISAMSSGDLDPQTKMAEVRNPEFLESETIFVADTSGSMEGKKLRKIIETMVITIEAFKRVREDLTGENLLMDDEDPFRIGVIKFAANSEEVTGLDEKLDDKKELKIIDKVSEVGGGTDETDALKDAHEELARGKKNVIKMIIVLTDGYGNIEAVQPILDQIDKDDQIMMLALGIGSEEAVGGVTKTYKQKERKNIFAAIAQEPEEILPMTLDFIKKQVEKRRGY